MADREAKTALFDEFARAAKALASGRRIELVDVLANGERTVEALAGEVGLSVANTSQRLQSAPGRPGHQPAGGKAPRSTPAGRAGGVRALAGPADPGRQPPGRGRAARRRLPRRARRAGASHPPGADPPAPGRRPGGAGRACAEYAAGHLPRSVSIPVGERRCGGWPSCAADREIVAYCRGPYCAFAHEAVAMPRQEGLLGPAAGGRTARMAGRRSSRHWRLVQRRSRPCPPFTRSSTKASATAPMWSSWATAGLVIDPARPHPVRAGPGWRRLQIAYSVETHLRADFHRRRPAAADGAQVLALEPAGSASPIAAWRTARRSTWAGSPCGCWPPPGTPPSTSATCSGRPAAAGPVQRQALLVGTVARRPGRPGADRAAGPGRLPSAPAAPVAARRAGRVPDPRRRLVLRRPVGDERTTTIGAERRHNRLLAALDEDTPCLQSCRQLRQLPAVLPAAAGPTGSAPSCSVPTGGSCPLLSNDRVQQHLTGGGLVVDAPRSPRSRPATSPGRSRSLRPAFASWLGWLVDDTPTAGVRAGRGPGPRVELARQCRTIGYDHLAGELAGAWAARGPTCPRPSSRWSRPTSSTTSPGVVLDVRQASEVDGHLPGALAVELGALARDRQSGGFRRGRSR